MINRGNKWLIYDYRLKDKRDRYMIIALRICMADGVLTSSLEPIWCRIFFGTQVLPKNRGHVLTPVFGTTINLYKMTSNEEVLYMKKLGIVELNNFVVRVVSIRFHLKGRNYV